MQFPHLTSHYFGLPTSSYRHQTVEIEVVFGVVLKHEREKGTKNQEGDPTKRNEDGHNLMVDSAADSCI